MRLSESKGLKAATMVFVKVGICLEIQRTPGKLGDGNAHDVKRVTLMALFLALSFFPVPVIEAAANAWRVAGALIGQPLVVVVIAAILLAATVGPDAPAKAHDAWGYEEGAVETSAEA
mmetsp:Transcript_2752/g.8114  ORF Transcript_2752/g.8114 Transcript_2752/m.8114 type:complete len:118 (+) Transcript_2752:417-770(+)